METQEKETRCLHLLLHCFGVYLMGSDVSEVLWKQEVVIILTEGNCLALSSYLLSPLCLIEQ